MKPKVSNFLLESRKRKGRTQRGFERHLFPLKGLPFKPSHNQTLLRHDFFSKFFACKLSAAKLEKNVASQNVRLCDILPPFFPTIPPNPPRGGFGSRLLNALFSGLNARAGCSPARVGGGKTQNVQIAHSRAKKRLPPSRFFPCHSRAT